MNKRKKNNIKVTVITVCYNSERTINQTLNSVANQVYDKIEHLIIDGKSSDQTINIVKKYSHIKKIISEFDNGIYHAMNKGLKIATGDIVGFLNSDDFYANNHVISKIVSVFMNNGDIDACYSDLDYIDQRDNKKIIRHWRSSKFVKGLFAKGWCPPHPTFFARRLLYESYGYFNLKYCIAADVELMMRFIEKYKIKSVYIPEVLIKMRTGGITNRSYKNIWTQNREILNSFGDNNLPVNVMRFIACKIISRSLQFFKK